MLRVGLGMTSFNSQTCLTSDDEIIKFCSNPFVEMSHPARQVYRQRQDSAHRHSYRRAYVTLHHICDKRVKHSEAYISFIRDHAEQFDRGISLSKFILGRNRTKSVVVNFEYGWPMFQLLRNHAGIKSSTRSFSTPTLTCGKVINRARASG
jgi:hypothetical protein